jgi:hypothetical protein
VKLLRLVAWILLIVLPPLLFYRYVLITTPNASVISLTAFQAQRSMPSAQIVALPEGTVIPVHIRISGDIFQNTQNLTLPLTLAKPVEIVMQDGKPTRQVRMAGDDWADSNEAGWIRIPSIQAELTPTSGPLFNTDLIINLHHQ